MLMEPSRIYKLRMNPEEVREFQRFLMEKSGLVFEGRRIAEMENAVAARVITLGLNSFAAYLSYLSRPGVGEEELYQLVLALTVGETRFFRSPEQFAALRKYILPKLISQERKQRRELRILSAGCATGEEPYSLAILLHQLVPDISSWKIQIVACDINREFLQVARQGMYSERKLHLVDPASRQMFFKRLAKNQWRVSPALARMITWRHFNLIASDYSPLLPGGLFHLVFCRNVIIYFNQATIKKVIANIRRILAEDGWLMLGYSESLFQIDNTFQTIHTPEAFFYQKTEKSRHSPRPLPATDGPYDREELLAALGSRPHPYSFSPLPPAREKALSLRTEDQRSSLVPAQEKDHLHREKNPPSPAVKIIPPLAPLLPSTNLPLSPRPTSELLPPPGRREEEQLWEEALELFAQERFLEAKELFKNMAQINPASARAHLGLGFLFANLDEVEQSREYAEKARRLDDLLPEIYFLLALLDERNGDFQRALQNYQRVILLAPDFAMAHFNLGHLFLKLKRPRDAAREFKNTRTILERDPRNPSLRFSGGLSRDALLKFCRLQIRNP